MKDSQRLKIRLIIIATARSHEQLATEVQLCEDRAGVAYERSLAVPHDAEYLPEGTFSLKRLSGMIDHLKTSTLYPSQ